MSIQDATTRMLLKVTNPEPAMLDREAAALRNVRRGVLDLICLFDQARSQKEKSAAWNAFAHHRLQWARVGQEMRRRLIAMKAFGVCDPDVSEAHVLNVLRHAADADGVLFSAGAWAASTLATRWTALVQGEGATSNPQVKEQYLAAILDRETELQARLAAHSQREVLDWCGDPVRARSASFHHVDWAPDPRAGFFLLLVQTTQSNSVGVGHANS